LDAVRHSGKDWFPVSFEFSVEIRLAKRLRILKMSGHSAWLGLGQDETDAAANALSELLTVVFRQCLERKAAAERATALFGAAQIRGQGTRTIFLH
jgi:hypothetical protein